VTKEEKLKKGWEDHPTPGAIDAFFLGLELRERARGRLFYGFMGLILAVVVISCFIPSAS